MRFNLILLVLVLVLVLVLEKSKFVKKLLDTASRTRTSTTTRTKSVLCNRVWNFTKMTLDSCSFTRAPPLAASVQSDRKRNLIVWYRLILDCGSGLTHLSLSMV